MGGKRVKIQRTQQTSVLRRGLVETHLGNSSSRREEPHPLELVLHNASGVGRLHLHLPRWCFLALFLSHTSLPTDIWS